MSPPTSADPIDGFAWAYRPLIVYAPSADSREMARQHALLSDVRDKLKARDIILIEIVADRLSVIVGPNTPIDAEALLSRVGLSTDQFGVALVGKDTGVKLLSNEVVAPESLFALIDAMPMRRREIRDRG